MFRPASPKDIVGLLQREKAGIVPAARPTIEAIRHYQDRYVITTAIGQSFSSRCEPVTPNPPTATESTETRTLPRQWWLSGEDPLL